MTLFFTRRTILNNGESKAYMAMPFKPNTMEQGSRFSNSRMIYRSTVNNTNNTNNTNKKISNNQWLSSDSYINLKKSKAIGKSSTKQGLPKDALLSFKNYDVNVINSKLSKVRGGGYVVPKKVTYNI
jgi:hypothetical protein